MPDGTIKSGANKLPLSEAGFAYGQMNVFFVIPPLPKEFCALQQKLQCVFYFSAITFWRSQIQPPKEVAYLPAYYAIRQIQPLSNSEKVAYLPALVKPL